MSNASRVFTPAVQKAQAERGSAKAYAARDGGRRGRGRRASFVCSLFVLVAVAASAIQWADFVGMRVAAALAIYLPTVNGPERSASRASVAAAKRQDAAQASMTPCWRHVAEGFPDTVTPELAKFIAEQDTAYLATASADGAPYVQHRGGPKGFIKVIDEKTLGFADYRGNRQYITLANLSENDRAFLFLLDPARKQRIKLWGRARVIENDAALVTKLSDDGYKARPERAILFTIEAWDVNCSSHIVARYTEEQLEEFFTAVRARVAELETENQKLRAALAQQTR